MAKKRNQAKNSYFPMINLNSGLMYVKESRIFIYLIIGFFLISSLVGFFFSDLFVFYNELLLGLNQQIQGLGWFGLIWFIFQNNVTSAFFAMFLGIIVGIVPLFNAITNGSLLGYVYFLASSEGGYSVIWYIVPHGIFELPAIFIALGMGLKLGMFVFAGRENIGKEFTRRLLSSIVAFLFVVLPLLIVAAIIEGTLIHFSG